MSQSHGIKGGTTDKVFQQQCVQWEEGASVGAGFVFLDLKIFYMHQNTYKTVKEMKTNKKHNRSPFTQPNGT